MSEFVYTPQPDGQLATSGNTESARSIPQEIYPALVVDVICDHYHPGHSEADGYNVGMIKVRVLDIDNSKSDSELSWAYPIEFPIQQLPLIGELVVCYKILGEFFFTRSIPLARRLQENGMLDLNFKLSEKAKTAIQDAIKKSPELTTSPEHRYGRYFKPDSRVRPLQHFEGDYVLQGRMGHSIRFGSSQMVTSTAGLAPNLILRTGQTATAPSDYATKPTIYGRTIEDINKDASSIWMVSDQEIPFIPATKDSVYLRSVQGAPQVFGGASITINSNRVILNAKESNILLFSNEGIHVSSFGDATIDSDSSIKLTATLDLECKTSRNIDFIADEDFTVKAASDVSVLSTEKMSLVSKKIFLGSIDNDEEPIVGGTTLAKFLARLILALVGNQDTPNPPASLTPGKNATVHVMTPMGPGQLSVGVIQSLKKLYSELAATNPGQKKNNNFAGAPFNSEANFVMLQNEEIQLPKNEYEQGSQLPVEKTKWVLTDEYYRIS